MDKANQIVEKMYNADEFSQWLGIERIEIKPGHCILRMKIRKEMLNGFKIAHGGIAFSLADSALAFAANSHGKHALTIELNASYIEPVQEEDLLTAISKEISVSGRIGFYTITILNQKNSPVSSLKGTVYISNKEWVV